MFGLSFLYPLFLAGALAVAIPIALHLFRRRTESIVDFPAVRLLHKAPVERQRRRRLRELILLALRVVALALLAFAFARPFFRASAMGVSAPITIVAVDASMSMSAPGQFEAARQAARKAVTDAPSEMLVGLVSFSDSATLVVPPTSDRGGVLAAIEASRATAGATRFRTALGRAAEAIGAAAGRIVVVTDLQQAGWETADEGAVPDAVAVEVVEVPAPDGNLAVTAVRREGQAVVAAVHNFGSRPARASARLRVDGRELGTERVEIGAAIRGRSAARRGARRPAAAPRFRSTISSATRRTISATSSSIRPNAVPVIVLTGDPPASSQEGIYVERALGVADNGDAFHVRTIDGRQFSALTSEQLGEPAAIVVLGTRTLDRRGRETIAGFLGNGGRVLLSLGPAIDLETLNDTIGTDLGVAREDVAGAGANVTLIAVDARHPIFRPFSSPTGALGDSPRRALPTSKRSERALGAGPVFGGRRRAHGADRGEGPVTRVHLGFGQPVESASAQPGLRAICRRISEIPYAGPGAAAVVGAARNATGRARTGSARHL